MKLQYIPEQNAGKKAGIGFGLGHLGQTVASLGQLGLDEKKRVRDEKIEDTKLTFAKNAEKRAQNSEGRAQESHALSQEIAKKNMEKLDYDLKVARDENASKQEQEAATVSVFRTLHPKATKSFNDNEVLAFAKDIDKFLPKDVKLKRLDVRVTPKGEKILTYESGGKIYEKNLGAVKTDWNKKKASSDIPEGSVSVGKEFYEEYADRGMVKIAKDGRFYAPINFVNAMQREQIGNGDEPIDTPL